MAKCATHLGDPHDDPQTSPQHADPHGLLVWFSLKKPQVHVDRRVGGWSAGRHVHHPCGWQISPWPARKSHFCVCNYFGVTGMLTVLVFWWPSSVVWVEIRSPTNACEIELRRWLSPAILRKLKTLMRLAFRKKLARQKKNRKKKMTSWGYFLLVLKGYFWRVFQNNLRKCN